MDKQTGICRKYLRTFAFLPLLRFALKVFKSDDNNWLKVFVRGRLLGLSGYFFFDNVVWAIKVRLLDNWKSMPFTKVLLPSPTTISNSLRCCSNIPVFGFGFFFPPGKRIWVVPAARGIFPLFFSFFIALLVFL